MTPVRTDEILLGKTIPYFVLGVIGLVLCLTLALTFSQRLVRPIASLSVAAAAPITFRGSLAMLTAASMLYLLVALGIGLLISSTVKSQFVASQITVLVTFLPAVMLSGFLFDLRSMPVLVRLVTYALPVRYYVALLQTIFLAGDIWAVILPNMAVLAGMAIALVLLTYRATRKTLA